MYSTMANYKLMNYPNKCRYIDAGLKPPFFLPGLGVCRYMYKTDNKKPVNSNICQTKVY